MVFEEITTIKNARITIGMVAMGMLCNPESNGSLSNQGDGTQVFYDRDAFRNAMDGQFKEPDWSWCSVKN